MAIFKVVTICYHGVHGINFDPFWASKFHGSRAFFSASEVSFFSFAFLRPDFRFDGEKTWKNIHKNPKPFKSRRLLIVGGSMIKKAPLSLPSSSKKTISVGPCRQRRASEKITDEAEEEGCKRSWVQFPEEPFVMWH